MRKEGLLAMGRTVEIHISALVISAKLFNFAKIHITKLRCSLSQRERGQWDVYYSSPKSFILKFSYSLGTFIEFCLVGMLS